MLIRHPATAGRDQVARNLAQFNPHPRFAADMVPALWAAAETYGIDPVVMVAQSGHETGWGHYGGLVPPHFHNTCGLKLRDLTPFPNSEVTAAHAQFPDWSTGAAAHAQHLLAYCQVAVPADQIVDPRWVWVYGRKAAITDVEQLGGSWAPSPAYGQLVAAAAAKLKEGQMVAQLEGFEWVGGPRASGSTYDPDGENYPWRIVLHTTETPPIARGGNPSGMAASHQYPPHVWYDWEADRGWQSVTLDRGAFALWQGSDAPYYTNRANALQVELIGYAEEAGGWPDIAYERIARRVVAPLARWARAQGGTVDLSDAAVPLPGAIPNSAREDAPQRLDPNRWAHGPIGLCGHRHVPMGDDHWDPGGLDLRRIARYAAQILGGTFTTAAEEEDLTPEQDQRQKATEKLLNDVADLLRHTYNQTAWTWNHVKPLEGDLDKLARWIYTDTQHLLAQIQGGGGGEAGEPVVDVAGSLAKATPEQLAGVGATKLLGALAVALQTQSQAPRPPVQPPAA